jgi:hypothetical protein
MWNHPINKVGRVCRTLACALGKSILHTQVEFTAQLGCGDKKRRLGIDPPAMLMATKKYLFHRFLLDQIDFVY